MADFGLQEHVTAEIHQQLPRGECNFYLSELKLSSLCLTGLVMLAHTLSPFSH